MSPFASPFALLPQQVQSRRTLLVAIVESYWNGEILDELETPLRFAENMTWKGKHRHVEPVPGTNRKGIRLAQSEMKRLEAQVQRLPGLEKWFVDIPWPQSGDVG